MTQKSEKFLNIAIEEARLLKDKRAESYALGYLGECYQQQNRLKEAIEVTQQALAIAQTSQQDNREISYLWQAQLGSWQKKQGNEKAAIASYSEAVNTLNSLRTDLNTSDRDIQFDFLNRVKPVYQSLADLLLKSKLSDRELKSLVNFDLTFSANVKQLSDREENRLSLVLRTIESLQLAELDNFLQDPCATESEISVQISDLDSTAAVIYPIILPDRLSIVVAIANRPLRQIVIPVSEKEVNEAIDELYDNLDNPTINNSARNILATANPNPEELKANGVFSSNPDKNFLITSDGAIEMKELSNLLEKAAVKKPELLVLSACETAVGDFRAILGLAGIAVRAGARSTIATLWSVIDASVTRLMVQFYQELNHSKINKAIALKNAQRKAIEFLRKNPLSENLNNLPPHPYDWASYVLVGNWL
ncbi:MAG: CHAT domain-containing protein [Xenococcaceae cyanobacterium]